MDPMNKTPRYIILGGGIAGLTAGLELLKRNVEVVILEKNPHVGGLARTIEVDGFRFDLGGHRFHSNNPQVVAWLKALLGEDLLQVARSSRIFIGGKFVDYPIQMPGALGIFPIAQALHMGVSYLQAALTNGSGDDISFEDWVVRRFGEKVYDAFFRPYTEKVWGIPCDQLSADWAVTRIGIPSLWQTLKRSIIPYKAPPATAISQFYYPRFGFGTISDRIADFILSLGGQTYTDTELLRIIPEGEQFYVQAQTGGQPMTFTADHVVSTLPVPTLLKAIPESFGSRAILAANPLDYRSLICVFLMVRKPQISPDHWTYFPGQEIVFGRTHEPKNWSSAMVPDPTMTSLCAEIFTGRGDPFWQETDDTLAAKTLKDLEKIGWVDPALVQKTKVVRSQYAYPIFDLGYAEKLARVTAFLRQWDRLHLVGRTGSFKYMNSDGVIEDVFRFIAQHFPSEQNPVQRLPEEIGRWA
jgi:protoporphyrinogen oxidase